MANVTHEVRVDLDTGAIPPVVCAHQNDTSRVVRVLLYFRNEAFDLGSSHTAKVSAKLPSIEKGYRVISGNDMPSAFTCSGNVIEFYIDDFLEVSGEGYMTVIIKEKDDATETVRPINIRLIIQQSADGASVIAGASDFPTTLTGIAENYLEQNAPTMIADYIQNEIGIATVAETKSYLGI